MAGQGEILPRWHVGWYSSQLQWPPDSGLRNKPRVVVHRRAGLHYVRVSQHTVELGDSTLRSQLTVPRHVQPTQACTCSQANTRDCVKVMQTPTAACAHGPTVATHTANRHERAHRPLTIMLTSMRPRAHMPSYMRTGDAHAHCDDLAHSCMCSRANTHRSHS